MTSVAEAWPRVTKGSNRSSLSACRSSKRAGASSPKPSAAHLTHSSFDALAIYAARRGCGDTSRDAQAHRRQALRGRVRSDRAEARGSLGVPLKGADTVIQENTEASPGVVTVKDAAPRRHIRPMARTSPKARCCCAPARGGPRELMLAAAMNHAELPVRRKPKGRDPRHWR